MKTYIRSNGNSTDIYMFLMGVSMGFLYRNLSAVACLVGNDAYPVNNFHHDVAICSVNRTIAIGEKLTVLLQKDEYFMEAIKGPVKLFYGYWGNIEFGDVRDIESTIVLHGELSSSQHSNFSAIRSVYKFDGSQDTFDDLDNMHTMPRYTVCLMTQIAPTTTYLDDWINYHRRLGVDMVYILDNHADDDLTQTYADREDVTVLYWPWFKSQTQAFTYFEVMSRGRCEWIVMCDVDEYIMLGVEEEPDSMEVSDKRPLHKYLRDMQNEGYGMVFFVYVEMRNSGYQYRVEPVPEKYIHRQTDQEFKNGKCACRTDNDWVASNIHKCVARKWRTPKLFNPPRREENTNDLTIDIYPRTLNDSGLLIHFKQKSWEDEIDRKTSPRNSLMSKGHNKTAGVPPSVEKVPRGFLSTNESDKTLYDHFRDIYRKVSQWEIPPVGVSWSENGRRCRQLPNRYYCDVKCT